MDNTELAFTQQWIEKYPEMALFAAVGVATMSMRSARKWLEDGTYYFLATMLFV